MRAAAEIFDFTILFNQLKVKLYNYVLKMTGDRMTSEDIVQNVFMKLYDSFHLIKKMESINYWIFKTARNEVFSYYRKKKVQRDSFNVADTDELEMDSGYNLEDIVDQKEIKALIENELDQCSAEQREVFVLKEYGGLSYSEIAGVMNIDEKLVKSRLFKIRQKLINKLSGIVR